MEMAYRRLDMSKIKFSGTLSMEEVLKDVTPMEWSQGVLDGRKKISITKAEKDYKSKCVRLELSY